MSNTGNPKGSSFQPQKGESQLPARLEELRAGLRQVSPYTLAFHTGATYQADPDGGGSFKIMAWGQEVSLSYPGLVATDPISGKELGADVQGLLLYYFTTSNGVPEEGRWISFSELPGGKF